MGDVVIYGATSCGVAAAIQTKRMGKSVLLIEPGSRIGGLTTGGLGQTDIGNKEAVGGISREFYERVRAYYDDPDNWRWQKPEEYRDGGQTRTYKDESAMWTFEPSAALSIYQSMLNAHGISVFFYQRLNRDTGVMKKGSRIVSISMDSGESYEGRMFIDATYEGDLMASAGVTYTTGRESNSCYDETLNGVQLNDTTTTMTRLLSKNQFNHNFVQGVDPFIVIGEPSSGLLPYIDQEGPGETGEGDHRIQSYCFRMCLTDHPDNRIPFEKPEGYSETDYELLLRNFEAGEDRIPWINSAMPNCKTDTNNKHGFSTDFIGQNYSFPEAAYGQREQIIERHRYYQKGLMWTLAYHPRVPVEIRAEVSRWGTCKDEFERDDGWQQQLYIRESRRMVSDVVMNQYHCEGLRMVSDSIGLAAYGMDSHNVQRYVDMNNHVRNEGNVEAKVGSPYPISYQAVVPKASQCVNLLVPVCLSASHIAYGSIRMEPVFMVIGQSVATAACLAIDDDVDLQDLDYNNLRERLLADKQRLEWE